MAHRGISISIKLISVSTLLLIVVISLFGFTNRLQSRKLLQESAGRLPEELVRGLQRTGKAQLELLAEATRITLVQSDYTTLQTIIQNTGKSDERVAMVAVIDPAGMVLSHSDAKQTGRPAVGPLKQSMAAAALEVKTGVPLGSLRTMTFAAPLSVGGRKLCTVFIAYSLAQLEAEIAKNKSLEEKADRSNLRSTLLLGVLAVLVGLILTIVQGIGLTRPIQAMARQADRIAWGDLKARVQVKSRDEIGLLGQRFNHLAEQIVVLLEQTSAKASMEKELAVASAIQATLVPEPGLVRVPGMELTGHFRPATHCGGDWWSYFRLTADRTLVLIGDVTGHGVGAAMITAAAMGAAETMLAVTGNQVELRQLLQAMNAAIHGTARGKFVMTCFASIYDPHNHTLHYANAGHNFAYYHDTATGKLNSLVVRGNRLGDLVASDFEIRQINVKPGDSLFWYTDGIVECENINGEEFGEKRFRDIVQRVVSQPLEIMLKTVLDKADGFYGGVPQKDDITMVVGKIV
jgi:serine phosphatase RsbU (regulator of sigma subunit)